MKFMGDQTPQKLRGGYYTPVDLASFIARWIAELKPEKVLEPSCGDGAFFQAMADVGSFERSAITGFELDEDEAGKAARRAKNLRLSAAKVRSEDFLGWAIENLGKGGERFDAVVGNPPFVRYQFLPPEFQLRAAAIFGELRLKFTELPMPGCPSFYVHVAASSRWSPGNGRPGRDNPRHPRPIAAELPRQRVSASCNHRP